MPRHGALGSLQRLEHREESRRRLRRGVARGCGCCDEAGQHTQRISLFVFMRLVLLAAPSYFSLLLRSAKTSVANSE
jgi:hypothetical protein